MAVARSCVGNHSATALAEAGNMPPWASPSISRPNPNIKTPVARPWLAQASDEKTMINTRPRRAPRMSLSFPPPMYMKA